VEKKKMKEKINLEDRYILLIPETALEEQILEQEFPPRSDFNVF